MKSRIKGLFSVLVMVGVCLYLPGGVQADDGIATEIKELKMQVERQQAQIDALNKGTASGTAAKGAYVSKNPLIDQVKISGDFRARYELTDRDYKSGQGDDDTRERLRSRFRLGLVWDNTTEGWQVGAGLTTGDDSPTSTNDDWSKAKPFETGDIRLDYAYAKHTWNDLSVTLGQHANPYKSSWVMWDGDVRLAGLTLALKQKSGLFATGGIYNVKYVDHENLAMLYMGQVGFDGSFSDKGKFTVATGYHSYSRELIRDAAANGEFNLGGVDPNDYAMNIADLYGDVSLPAGPVALKLYGQIWMNFGADGAGSQAGAGFTKDPEDSDLGWVFGVDAKMDKFKLGYAYSVVEADSLFGYLADQDFGERISDTNKKGHKLAAGYSMTKNWSTALTYLLSERNKDYAGAQEDSVSVTQFDVSYKF